MLSNAVHFLEKTNNINLW